MSGRELIMALNEVSRRKSLTIEEVIEALEEALEVAYFKHIRAEKKDKERLKEGGYVKAKVDVATGDVEIVHKFHVVKNVEDRFTQISVDKARKLGFDAKPGDTIEIRFDPHDFSRNEVNIVMQVFNQRIQEAQKEHKFAYLKELEGGLVRGRIIGTERKKKGYLDVKVDIEGIETKLLPEHQVRAYKREDGRIIGDTYRRGEYYDFYLKEVVRRGKGKGNFDIIISRSDPKLVVLLLEREVPDIGSNFIEVKDVAREPGRRSKVSVLSLDSRIDPVAACIGPRGKRIKDVQKELRGEKVDIIRWSADPEEYIRNAMSPAEVERVELVDEENKIAKVYVYKDNVKQAIGEDGLNVKLAEQLTGWKIEIVEVGSEGEGGGGIE